MTRLKSLIILLTGLLFVIGLSSLIIYRKEKRDDAITEGLAEARMALREGRPSAAVAAYEDVLDTDQGNVDAALELFDTVAFFDPEKGRELIGQLQRMKVDPEERLYREMLLAFNENDLEAMRSIYAQLEAHRPFGREGSVAEVLFLILDDKSETALPLLKELDTSHPEDREIRLLSSSLNTFNPNFLARVQAKDTLMRLLDQPDVYAFKAALTLLLQNSLPLYPADYSTITEQLAAHPWLEEGLASLSLEELRALALQVLPRDKELALTITDSLIQRTGLTDNDWVIRLLAAQDAKEWESAKAAAANLSASTNEFAKILLARQYATEGEIAKAAALFKELQQSKADDQNFVTSLVWILQLDTDVIADSEKAVFAELLARYPGAAADTVLQAANFRMRVSPEKREAIVDETIDLLREKDPLRLARWLIANNGSARVPEFINREKAAGNPDWANAYFDALISDGQIEAAAAFINEASPILEDWQTELLRCVTLTKKGEKEAAIQHIQSLSESLPNTAGNALFLLADLANELDNRELQESILEVAYRKGLAFPLAEAMTYLSILLDKEDQQEATRFAAYCRSLNPNDPIYINNHVYLQLVAGKEVDRGIEDMRELVGQYPNFSAFRLTLALAEMLGGYTGLAKERIDALGDAGDSPQMQEARSQLGVALVLAASGDRKAAAEIVAGLDISAFMEDEQKLVDLYMRDGSF